MRDGVKYGGIGLLILVAGATIAVAGTAPLNPFHPLNVPLNMSGEYIFDSTGDLVLNDTVSLDGHGLYGLSLLHANETVSSAALPAAIIDQDYLHLAGDAMKGPLDMAMNRILNVERIGVQKAPTRAEVDVDGDVIADGHIQSGQTVSAQGLVTGGYQVVKTNNRAAKCPAGYAVSKVTINRDEGELDEPIVLHCIELGTDILEQEYDAGGTGANQDEDYVNCNPDGVVTGIRFATEDSRYNNFETVWCRDVDGTVAAGVNSNVRNDLINTRTCPTGTYVSGFGGFGSRGNANQLNGFNIKCSGITPDIGISCSEQYSHSIDSLMLDTGFNSVDVNIDLTNSGRASDIEFRVVGHYEGDGKALLTDPTEERTATETYGSGETGTETFNLPRYKEVEVLQEDGETELDTTTESWELDSVDVYTEATECSMTTDAASQDVTY